MDARGFQACLEEWIAGIGNRESICQQLRGLRAAVEGTSWRFWGTSVLFVFDGACLDRLPRVCLIDFASCDMNAAGAPGCDEGLMLGLSNLVAGFELQSVST
jgi:hypothetical protein